LKEDIYIFQAKKTVTRQAAEIQQLKDELRNMETKLNESVQRTEELLSEEEKQKQQISIKFSLEVENKLKQSLHTQYEDLAKTKAGVELTAKRQLCEWEVCVFKRYLKMLCLYLLCQNFRHLTFEPYLGNETYSRKYEKLPNVVINGP